MTLLRLSLGCVPATVRPPEERGLSELGGLGSLTPKGGLGLLLLLREPDRRTPTCAVGES